jgi:hypothetical protein
LNATIAEKRVDWAKLLGDIQYLLGEEDAHNPAVRVPIGTATLAVHLGVSRGAVRNWIDGTQPRHDEGERLIERWCRLAGKGRANLPLTTASYSASKRPR